MSSRKGHGSFSNAGSSGSKGKGKSNASVPAVNQLAHGVSAMNMSSGQDDGWEVIGKKPKGRGGSSSARQPLPQQPAPRAWGQPDTAQRLGVRSYGGPGRGSGPTSQPPSANSNVPVGRGYARPLAPTLVAASHSSEGSRGHMQDPQRRPNVSDDEDLDDFYESDDDLDSDNSDSDEGQKSYETRKNNKWFKDFFQSLEDLTIEQINDSEREWHCPACKGGCGATEWYLGILPLIAHAKTKRSFRWKLHRDFAEVLEEELSRRGTSAIPAGEIYGKWKGLDVKDRAVLWPPVVMIYNTWLDHGDKDEWIGMGNQELLDYFPSYSAIDKARHSYGPQGHRGISALIFDASAPGYLEADRLSKQFEDAGRDRQAWVRNSQRFFEGKRLLFGFMAEKQDMENFNQHCPDKTKLKYEMKSYQEMVVQPMKQMFEDNQQLLYLRSKVDKELRNNKALAESHVVMAEKWRKVSEENKTLKSRTKKHHEQSKEQMDYQEKFYREEIQQLYDVRSDKEEYFELIQLNEREKIQFEANKSLELRVKSREEAALLMQDKEMEEYLQKRDEMLKEFQQKAMELKRKYLEEEMALEKRFDAGLDLLLNKYAPK